MNPLKRIYRGFTLIELLVVIVILGVLAATALPKYQNMRREARIAAIHGFSGALQSAIGQLDAMVRVPGIGTRNGSNLILTMSDQTTVETFGHQGSYYGRPNTNSRGIASLMKCTRMASIPIGSLPYGLYDCQGFTLRISESMTQWETTAYFFPPSIYGGNPSDYPDPVTHPCFASYTQWGVGNNANTAISEEISGC